MQQRLHRRSAACLPFWCPRIVSKLVELLPHQLEKLLNRSCCTKPGRTPLLQYLTTILAEGPGTESLVNPVPTLWGSPETDFQWQPRRVDLCVKKSGSLRAPPFRP